MSYGLGIIGLGLIADFHAKAIRAISGGKGALVACCSRNTEKAKRFAEKHNCRGYADIGEFLAHPGLDVVSICSPSGAHLDTAIAAAKAGKHVIVEKPMASSKRWRNSAGVGKASQDLEGEVKPVR